MTNLGWLYEKGKGVTQDYSKAREWYQKAADAGNADAKEALAHLLQVAVQPTAQPTQPAPIAISKIPSSEVANEPCQWWWGLTGKEVGQKQRSKRAAIVHGCRAALKRGLWPFTALYPSH
jgi:TPR repeat protein